MELPHISNNLVNQERAEAVTANLYKMNFFPPTDVPVADTATQELTSVTGLEAFDATPEQIEQKSMGVTRKYTGVFVDDTAPVITLTFNLNLHGANANSPIIYQMWKRWRNKSRNPLTGSNGLYKDYVGGSILYLHNAVGDVWRTIDIRQCHVANITGFDEVAIENGDPSQLIVELVCNEAYDTLFEE